MGERCDIMNDIADALAREDEHRRWARENGYTSNTPNCNSCAKMKELQRQYDKLFKEYISVVDFLRRHFGTM